MTINKWAFFWGLAVYLTLSIFMFLISGGWAFGIFMLLFFVPSCIIVLLGILFVNNINIGFPVFCIVWIFLFLFFYKNILILTLMVLVGIVLFLIYFTAKNFYNDKKIDIRPNISFILIWFLILFQILILLFSGDSCSEIGELSGLEGSYFVYEKLLGYNGREYCGTGIIGDNPSWVNSGIVLNGYFSLLVFIIIRAYYLAFKNRNKDDLNNKIPKTKILIGIGSLIIVTSLILYSLFVIANIESTTDQALRSEPFNLHRQIRSDYFESGDYNSVATQKDGKIIVGGNFTTYLGQEANRIIRLNTDGSVDTSFDIGTGFDNAVQTVVIQDDGKILVGGTFSTYKGSVANRIIRLNTDGIIDTIFNVGSGFNHKYAYINTIATQKDGKIIVAGNFGEYKGVSANRILRLNTDGSRDKTFISQTNFNSTIYNIKIQSDGKILVAGGFDRLGEGSKRAINKVVRLNYNGSLDNSFRVDLGGVKFITEQSDGKIILVGDFDTYKGVSANGIIRINPDGSIDKSFNPQIQSKYDAKTVAIHPDGKILVGGDSKDFTDNITDTKGVIRLNSDGSKDETFSKGLIKSPYNGFQENIRSIVVQSDGKIIVVGDFYNHQGRMEKDIPTGIARLNSDGSWDNTFLIMRSSPLPIYSSSELRR